MSKHNVMPADVHAVLTNNPLFFLNLPDKTASYIMIGPDDRARVLYVALLETPDAGIWKPITGWESRLARRIYYQRESEI